MNKPTQKLIPVLTGLMLVTAGTDAQTPATEPGGASLDWMAGDWCQQQGAALVEEHWLPARGGLLLGMGRTVADGKVRSFEFLRIDLRADKPVFIAQPDGVPPTEFKLTASGPGWARFENPQHDFPKRVEYRRTSQGLHAEIAGPADTGKETVIPFDYLKCPESTP
jgi:hypothetical protein